MDVLQELDYNDLKPAVRFYSMIPISIKGNLLTLCIGSLQELLASFEDESFEHFSVPGLTE